MNIWLLLLLPVAFVSLVVFMIQVFCGKSNRSLQEPTIFYMSAPYSPYRDKYRILEKQVIKKHSPHYN